MTTAKWTCTSSSAAPTAASTTPCAVSTPATGRDDLIAFYGYSTGAAALWTFIAQADGTLDRPFKSWNVESGTWERDRVELMSGDYNGDKRTDAAVMYRHDGGVTALHTFTAQSSGGFGAPLEGWKSQPETWYASSSGCPD